VPGIDACLSEAMAIPGVRGASLVDWSSGLLLGAAGEGPNGDHDAAAAEATEVARAAVESSSIMATASGKLPVQDIMVTTSDGYHLIRFVDTVFDSNVLFYLWLDRAEANLALARFHLQALAGQLVLV
jgi:predicted regulator of Ras-like GTPase activity (Roadblock/LC7/MglB family)